MAISTILKKLNPSRLRYQLILGIAGILAVLMSLLVVLQTDRQKNFFLKLNHERAYGLSTTLASTANSYVISYELAGLQKLVSTYKNNPGLQYAIVTSNDGVVLAHTDSKYIGLKAVDSISNKLKPINEPQTLIENNSMLDMAAPIIDHDEIVGWARIGLSQEYIQPNLREIKRSGLLFILISIILGSAFAIIVAGRLSKGLQKLISAAKKIKEGNRDVRVGASDSFEITALGIAFNQMLDDINANEKLLSMVLENLPVGVFILDKDGKIISVNPAGAEIWKGVKNVGVDGFDILNGWFPDTGKKLEPHEWGIFIALKKGRPVLNQEIEIECFDKTHKIILNSAIPLWDSNEKLIGAITINVDITGRKKTEIKIQESEEKFRMSFMTSQDAFYIGTLHEGRIIDVNNSFHDLFGYAREECIGKTIAELNIYVYPEEREKMIAGINTHGKIKDLELTCRNKNGELMIVSVTVNIWQMNNEEVIMAVVRDITERKKTEKELRTINHAIGERVKELNCLYKVSDLSNAPDKTMEDILKECVDIIPPSYQYPEITCARIVFNGRIFESADFLETEWKQESDIIIKNNVVGKAVVFYKEQMKDEYEGPFLKEERLMINSIVDILGSSAERKKAETTIKEQAEIFTAIIENANESIFLISPDLKVLQFNKTARDRMKINSGKEIRLGVDFREYIYPGREKPFLKMFSDAVAGKHTEMEFSQTNIDNQQFWLRSRTYPVYDPNEKLMGVTVLVENITDRKNAEKELKDSEEKFRSLVEDTSVGVFILQDEKIIYANPGFENICGYSNNELLNGMSFQQLIYEDDAEWVKDNYELRISGQKPSDEYMLRAMRKDGELIYVDVIVSRIVYDNKPAVIGSVVDKTRHVEEEKLMGRAVTEAQEKERTQIGMELHDNVKQIMAASLMSLDYIKNNIDNKKECLDTIKNVKGYIHEAINELRRLSHQLAPTVDDDNGTLVEKIEKLINDSKISDKVEMLLDIDEFNTPMNAEIQLAFYRIMQEQFNNILKYSKASTVLIRIKKKDGFLNMTIKDDGVGFDTTAKKGGIGLENIRRRVNVLSGNVKIVSSPGEGCQVNVSVPAD